MTELPQMIQQARKRETEARLYKMWLVQFGLKQLFGGELKPYDELLREVFADENQNGGASTKTAQEIEFDAMQAVERYEKFAGKGGNA